MAKRLPEPKGGVLMLSPEARAAYQRKYPAHTCVDRPELPCDACEKWAKKKKRVSRKRA